MVLRDLRPVHSKWQSPSFGSALAWPPHVRALSLVFFSPIDCHRYAFQMQLQLQSHLCVVRPTATLCARERNCEDFGAGRMLSTQFNSVASNKPIQLGVAIVEANVNLVDYSEAKWKNGGLVGCVSHCVETT